MTDLHDNSAPRYLPHMHQPQILQMGLAPMEPRNWIETDNQLGNYYRHKLQQRERRGDEVYRATPASQPVQRELARSLQQHLTTDQPRWYRAANGEMECLAGGYRTPLDSDSEPLWACSLWVADDLVIMEPGNGDYRLTAASLCSPSHWRLEEKFGRPLREIHDPIPGFHRALTPRIDRFFGHLKPAHPVVRYNWALQADDRLYPIEVEQSSAGADTPLYYRSERQSLVRLPASGAVAFTIRVYIHPLEQLRAVPDALPSLVAAIDQTPPALAAYKGFDRLAPALNTLRATCAGPDHRRAGTR